MPYRKPPFITDGYYHLVNRGVAKQPIFLQKEDYERFIWQIFRVTKAKKKNLEDRRARGTKLLSFFQNDPKIYERFVLFELQNESPDLLHY